MEGQPNFSISQKVFALNLKYKDGTRLRSQPQDSAGHSNPAEFNGVWLPNDQEVEILKLESGFALVRKKDGDSGWIRLKNLTDKQRLPGVTKDVVSSELVTPDPEYVRGIKIYNCGIKEDAVVGSKFGKGLQHLISSQWLNAMSEFVASFFTQIQAFVRHARAGSEKYPMYDFIYFTNMSNHLFNRADALGLKSTESLHLFLMATYLIMVSRKN